MSTWFKIHWRSCALTFAAIIGFCWLADLLSLFTYLYPSLMPWFFIGLCLIVAGFTWRRSVYGLYFIIAELALSSQGYLFFYPLGHFKISLRMAIFAIVLGLWLIKKIILWSRRPSSAQQPRSLALWWRLSVRQPLGVFYPYYLLLAAAILWGLLWGFFQHHAPINILSDFNNWLFFLLAPLVMDVLKTPARRRQLIKIILAVVAAVALCAFLVEYLYSHQFEPSMFLLFRWFTDYFLGDITFVGYNFYRVFFESQIYALVGLSLLIAPLAWKRNFFRDRQIWLWLWLIIASTAVIISFSRSYWVGFAGGLFIFAFWTLITRALSWRAFWLWVARLAAVLIASLALAFVILILPPGQRMVNFSRLLSDRLTQNEAASQTRINQLQPLGQAIARHPLIGSGWGTTVTYKTLDPRYTHSSNPEGLYTTYAFEWGYLDFILKFGLVGLFIYALLLWQTFKHGLRLLRHRATMSHSHLRIAGWLLSLLVIMGVHFFSPYLNHPLGICVLLLTQAWILNTHPLNTPHEYHA